MTFINLFIASVSRDGIFSMMFVSTIHNLRLPGTSRVNELKKKGKDAKDSSKHTLAKPCPQPLSCIHKYFGNNFMIRGEGVNHHVVLPFFIQRETTFLLSMCIPKQ